MSLARMITASIHIPHGCFAKSAEMIPIGVPMSRAMPTATTPTSSVIRAPTITQVNVSRPKVSVPNGWARLPPCSLAAGSIAFASYGVHTKEMRASPTMSMTSAAPMIIDAFNRRPPLRDRAGPPFAEAVAPVAAGSTGSMWLRGFWAPVGVGFMRRS